MTTQAYTRGQNFNLIIITTEKYNGDPTRNRRFRFRVHTDTYAFQAYARLEIFDGIKWHTLHRIPGELMDTDKGLAYSRLSDEEKARQCSLDIETLREQGLLIAGATFTENLLREVNRQ